MTDRVAARQLIARWGELLQPLVEDGNPFAVEALGRIRAAEDPVAEAQRVLDDAADQIREAMEWFVDWLEGHCSQRPGLAASRCWRCDAHRAETDVGLCESCRDHLRGGAIDAPT